MKHGIATRDLAAEAEIARQLQSLNERLGARGLQQFVNQSNEGQLSY